MKRVMVQWLCMGLVCGLGAVGCSSESEDPGDVGELQDAGPDSSEPDVADEDDAGEDAGGDADEDPDTGDDAGDDTGDAGEEPDADETPVGDGSSCEQAIDVSEGIVLENETTVGGPETQDADGEGCPSGRISGPERFYVVQPEVATNYRVRVEPADVSFDPMIYVRSSCETSVCLDGTVFNGPGDPETLSFEAPAGVASYIIVDGQLLSEGGYRLEVTIEE